MEPEAKIKVMTVFGTRPEAIKMAPVILELAKYPDKIIPVVAVTAQHREMLDQVLRLFRIRPAYDLNIMAEGQTLFDITERALTGLDRVLTKEAPDLVLVHGDICRGAGRLLSSDGGRACRSGASHAQ